MDTLAAQTYRPLLQPGLHKVIGFARRAQGLIVARGNPLGLTSLADVARTGARFVNRPLGTGTRVLLTDLLAQAGLEPAEIEGYDRDEPSHAALAQAIAAGSADVGMFVERHGKRALQIGAQRLDLRRAASRSAARAAPAPGARPTAA